MIRTGVYAPTAFSLELLAKDLALVVTEARRPVPAAQAALEAALAAVAAGRGDDDYASLAGYVEEAAD